MSLIERQGQVTGKRFKFNNEKDTKARTCDDQNRQDNAAQDGGLELW